MTAFNDIMGDYFQSCARANRWRCNVFYFVVGLSLSALVFLDFPRLFQPKPYGKVELLERRQKKNDLYLSFHFEKHGCRFQRLLIIGVVERRRQDVLKWQSVDADGRPEGPTRDTIEGRQLRPDGTPPEKGTYDRSAGPQIWHVKVKIPSPLKYDYIEIRTRHICDDVIVDRTFAKVKT